MLRNVVSRGSWAASGRLSCCNQHSALGTQQSAFSNQHSAMARVLFPALVAVLLAASPGAAAQSASQLLEKGIYTEETVGDLDGAIKIYKQIVAEAKANRKFAAQAQYRLGHCLWKQGKKEEGKQAFQALIQDFPEQAELVQKAREFVPAEPQQPELKLDPLPWVDGEHLELRIKLAGGLEIGEFILSARSGKVDGREVWYLALNRNIAPNAPNLALSRVVADRRTFQPISSTFRHSLMGTVEGEYTAKQVTVRSRGVDGKESVKKLDLDGVYYDNEQGWHAFRLLPLTDNYKGSMPICATFGGGLMKLETEVTGKETIEVAAGKFECYKLLVKPVQQTFWISSDSHRYAVKFEAGGVIGELQSIRQVKPGETVSYDDPKLGFSLSTPADWYVIPDKTAAKESERVLMLVDPEAEAVSALVVQPLESLKEQQRTSLRAWAEERLAEGKKVHKGHQVRPDSWQERKVAGHPALSYVADFEQGSTKRAKYCVFVLGKSTAAHFSANTERDRLEEFRKKFDKIIDGYKAK